MDLTCTAKHVKEKEEVKELIVGKNGDEELNKEDIMDCIGKVK